MLSDDLLRTITDRAWKLAADYSLSTATRHDARRFILATAVAAAYRQLTDDLYAQAKSYTEQGDALRENVYDDARCPAIGDGNARCCGAVNHPGAHQYDFPRPMGVVLAEAARAIPAEPTVYAFQPGTGDVEHPRSHPAIPDPNDSTP